MVDYVYINLVNDDETLFSLNPYIDRDSVKMSVAPRVSRVITTIDGREHISGWGNRQTLSFKFNPLTRDQAVDLVSRMGQASAFKVDFRGLIPPDSDDGYYDMRLSQMSADYLSRCKFGGQKWYQFDELELVQL